MIDIKKCIRSSSTLSCIVTKKTMIFVFFYTLFAIKHNFITWFFTFCINNTKMVDPVLMLVVGWCRIWCENVTIITLIFFNGFYQENIEIVQYIWYLFFFVLGTNHLDIASVLSGFIEIDIKTTIVPRNSVSFLSSLPVSLYCHFLIVPSVFSNVYLEKMTVS